MTTTAEIIMKAVSTYYGVKPVDLRGPRRDHYMATARAVGMYLTRELTALSYPSIGAYYGGRDHSTAIAAVEKVRLWLEEGGPKRNQLIVEGVASLRAQLAEEVPVRIQEQLIVMRSGLLRQIHEAQLGLKMLDTSIPPTRGA